MDLNINGEINISEAETIVNNATTTEGIDNAVATLRTALTSYLAGIENEKIDITAALIDNASPGTAGNTDYWTNSSNPGLEYNLYEFYNVANATTKQTIAQQLPAGFYTLTAIAYTREGYNAYLIAGSNQQTLVGVAKSTVNNRNQGNNWIADGNGVNEMLFQLEEATSNLEIGINSGTAKSFDRKTLGRLWDMHGNGTVLISFPLFPLVISRNMRTFVAQ